MSYTKFPREDVIAACEACLAAIYKGRKEREAQLRWWHGNIERGMARIAGWGTETVADNLLRLARVSKEKTIAVSAKDFYEIERYWPRQDQGEG